MAIEQNFPDIYAGDDITWSLTFTDSNGDPVNISNSTINFVVKENISDTDANAKINKNITSHTYPTLGLSEMSLTSDETDVTPGLYYGEFTYTTSGGSITTLASTYITILEKVKDV